MTYVIFSLKYMYSNDHSKLKLTVWMSFSNIAIYLFSKYLVTGNSPWCGDIIIKKEDVGLMFSWNFHRPKIIKITTYD